MTILLGNRLLKSLSFLFPFVCRFLKLTFVVSISLKVKENLSKCFKIMNKSNFDFILKVSSRLIRFSQFSDEVCNWIACQFALESSFGCSNLASSNFNFCGMKNPLVRISSAIHAGDGNFHWAQYNDLDSCIVDYLLCLQYHRPLSSDYDSVSHFSRFISKFYCPERTYLDKINLIYQQFKTFKS